MSITMMPFAMATLDLVMLLFMRTMSIVTCLTGELTFPILLMPLAERMQCIPCRLTYMSLHYKDTIRMETP